ncbi:hypothetical protein F4823DRAFT_413257 [Ustulina deusta]|nr:hypothetical protein F4823DRAFT_413257 [Ustulina deusta]
MMPGLPTAIRRGKWGCPLYSLMWLFYAEDVSGYFPLLAPSVRFWGRGEELIVLSRLANRVECVPTSIPACSDVARVGKYPGLPRRSQVLAKTPPCPLSPPRCNVRTRINGRDWRRDASVDSWLSRTSLSLCILLSPAPAALLSCLR